MIRQVALYLVCVKYTCSEVKSACLDKTTVLMIINAPLCKDTAIQMESS
jgi:hypothetical protein